MTRVPRRPRFKGWSANKLVPNMVTVLALCAGMTAIRFGLQDRWQLAVACVVFAGILDGLDGRLARLLGGTSRFGAELDSLSDFIGFGVAPALLLYFWTLGQAPSVGWPIALFYAVCCALRLARFNVAVDEDDRPPWAAKYFTGVPAPAGAGLAILPMMLEFEVANGIFQAPALVGAWTLAVGLLMVSHIPTMSLKSFKVSQKFVLPTLLFVGLMAASVASNPWSTLSVVGMLYLGSIPVSVLTFQRHRRRDTRELADGGETAAPAADPSEEPAVKKSNGSGPRPRDAPAIDRGRNIDPSPRGSGRARLQTTIRDSQRAR